MKVCWRRGPRVPLARLGLVLGLFVLLQPSLGAQAQSADDAAGFSSPPDAPAPPPAAPAPVAPAPAVDADDAAGFSLPVESPAPAVDADDAAGFSLPVGSPAPPIDADDAAGFFSLSDKKTASPGSEDDGAGWGGAGPSAESTTPAAEPEPSPATLPHLDAKFRDRRGVWLRPLNDESRLAQLRSSLDVSVSYAPTFTVAGLASSFKLVGGMRGELDAAYKLQRDTQDRPMIDSKQLRVIGLESYLALRIGNFELKSGRMIMPLGTGEAVSSVDVVSPRDLRQPGLVDNENMRLAVLATRASITLGAHLLEAIIVHESYFGLLPPVLGRFSPLRRLLSEDSGGGERLNSYDWRYKHHPDRLDPAATQAVGHYTFTGSGFDLDFYGGSVLDQLGVAQRPEAAAFERPTVTLDLYHPRYTLLAHTGSATVGNFLLRWELSAYLNRVQSLRRVDQPFLVIDLERKTQLNGLLGVTYFGIPNGTLSLEVMQSGVLDNPARKREARQELLWPVEAPTGAFRWAQTLLSDRLTLEAVAIVIGVKPFNGALLRGDVGWSFDRGLSLHLIYAHYQSSDDFGLMYGFSRNDRLDLSFCWAFGL